MRADERGGPQHGSDDAWAWGDQPPDAPDQPTGRAPARPTGMHIAADGTVTRTRTVVVTLIGLALFAALVLVYNAIRSNGGQQGVWEGILLLDIAGDVFVWWRWKTLRRDPDRAAQTARARWGLAMVAFWTLLTVIRLVTHSY